MNDNEVVDSLSAPMNQRDRDLAAARDAANWYRTAMREWRDDALAQEANGNAARAEVVKLRNIIAHIHTHIHECENCRGCGGPRAILAISVMKYCPYPNCPFSGTQDELDEHRVENHRDEAQEGSDLDQSG